MDINNLEELVFNNIKYYIKNTKNNKILLDNNKNIILDSFNGTIDYINEKYIFHYWK